MGQISNLVCKNHLIFRNCGYELAIKKDPFYCLKSDLYKILHPKIVVEDSYVFRDYGGNDLARSIIRN